MLARLVSFWIGWLVGGFVSQLLGFIGQLAGFVSEFRAGGQFAGLVSQLLGIVGELATIGESSAVTQFHMLKILL